MEAGISDLAFQQNRTMRILLGGDKSPDEPKPRIQAPARKNFVFEDPELQVPTFLTQSLGSGTRSSAQQQPNAAHTSLESASEDRVQANGVKKTPQPPPLVRPTSGGSFKRKMQLTVETLPPLQADNEKEKPEGTAATKQRAKTAVPVPRLGLDRLKRANDRPHTAPAPAPFSAKESAFVTGLLSSRGPRNRSRTGSAQDEGTNALPEQKFAQAWGEVSGLMESVRDVSRPLTQESALRFQQGSYLDEPSLLQTARFDSAIQIQPPIMSPSRQQQKAQISPTNQTQSALASPHHYQPQSARPSSLRVPNFGATSAMTNSGATPRSRSSRSQSVGSSATSRLVGGWDDPLICMVRQALEDDHLRDELVKKADNWKRIRKEGQVIKKNYVEMNVTAAKPTAQDRFRRAMEQAERTEERALCARQQRVTLEREWAKNTCSRAASHSGSMYSDAASPTGAATTANSDASSPTGAQDTPGSSLAHSKLTPTWKVSTWAAACELTKTVTFFESFLTDSRVQRVRLEAARVICRAVRRFLAKLKRKRMDSLLWQCVKFKYLFMTALKRRRRRKAAETIALFLQHVRSGGKLWFAMKRYRARVMRCFEVMHRFLIRHRTKMQLLTLQYNAVESDIINKFSREYLASVRGPLPFATAHRARRPTADSALQTTSPTSDPSSRTGVSPPTVSRPSTSLAKSMDSFPSVLAGNPLQYIGPPKRYLDFPLTYCIYPPSRTPSDTAQLCSSFFLTRGCNSETVLSMEKYEALYSRPAIVIDPASSTNIPKRVCDVPVLISIHRTAASVKARLLRHMLTTRLHKYVVETIKWEKDMKEYKRKSAAHEILQQSLPKTMTQPTPPQPSATSTSTHKRPTLNKHVTHGIPPSPLKHRAVGHHGSTSTHSSTHRGGGGGGRSGPQPPPPLTSPSVLDGGPPVRPTLRVLLEHEEMKKLVLVGLKETVQLVETALERAETRWGPKEDKIFILERFVLDMKREERLAARFFAKGIEEPAKHHTRAHVAEMWHNKILSGLRGSTLDPAEFGVEPETSTASDPVAVRGKRRINNAFGV